VLLIVATEWASRPSAACGLSALMSLDEQAFSLIFVINAIGN
jgi:hypothetical protein